MSFEGLELVVRVKALFEKTLLPVRKTPGNRVFGMETG